MHSQHIESVELGIRKITGLIKMMIKSNEIIYGCQPLGSIVQGKVSQVIHHLRAGRSLVFKIEAAVLVMVAPII